MISITAIVLAATVGLTAAAPTETIRDSHTPTVPLTGVTHSVVAGLGGLRFEPDNVVAQPGDVVQFEFNPANHAVAQSSFAEPCKPLADGTGFYSGFNFATTWGKNPNVFQIVVNDTKPIWYYCPQLNGNHCQRGMVGAINQNFDRPEFSLARYREAAAGTGTSVIPPVVQGGVMKPNPNP